MSKSKVNIEKSLVMTYSPGVRPVIHVFHHDFDQTVETLQGKSHSVQELYQDFVLGRLDQSKLGGDPVYDEDSVTDHDPFNVFGMTLEQVSEIRDRGTAANAEVLTEKAKQEKAAAEQAAAEQEAKIRAKIEKEIRERGEGVSTPTSE